MKKFCLATWSGLVLARLTAGAEVDSSMWKNYTDPQLRFSIQHPRVTEPKTVPDQEAGLLSRVAFEFEQPFQSGADAGSLKFRFQISVWQNTNHLTAEAWVKQNLKPEAILETRTVQVAGRSAVRVKTSNLAWTVIKNFLVDQDRTYELSHMDLAAHTLLPEATRSHWTSTFDKMLGSLRILSERK